MYYTNFFLQTLSLVSFTNFCIISTITSNKQFPETYLEPSQTSAMKLFTNS